MCGFGSDLLVSSFSCPSIVIVFSLLHLVLFIYFVIFFIFAPFHPFRMNWLACWLSSFPLPSYHIRPHKQEVKVASILHYMGVNLIRTCGRTTNLYMQYKWWQRYDLKKKEKSRSFCHCEKQYINGGYSVVSAYCRVCV